MTTIHNTDPLETITHVWSDDEQWAIDAALAADRPLLIRGEPGVGKTQLAWAAAARLKRALVTFAVDSRTESRDLLWQFDAVQRLAEAQVISHLYQTKEDLQAMRGEIDVHRFVYPGPMWWAIDWKTAEERLAPGHSVPCKVDGTPGTAIDGVVVLIDEIDKAESDVPNGLLEAFAMRRFTPPGHTAAICRRDDSHSQTPRPLVIVTTNEERMLPDAFLRRCFVLHVELPDEQQAQAFNRHLIERGRAHFQSSGDRILKDAEAFESLLLDAANLLRTDRIAARRNQHTPLPGQAEYLDFLRAILKLASEGRDYKEVFRKISRFAFEKSQGAAL